MNIIHRYSASLGRLFFPLTCRYCGNDIYAKEQILCTYCLAHLPHTTFASRANNPIERIFMGRINIQSAHSEFYFSKNECVQYLIHRLKYKQDKTVGKFLGEICGRTLLTSGRFSNLDYIIPLPLFKDKQFKRGYNQAEVICNGISDITNVPVLPGNVIRERATETQTRKHRSERWHNVAESFVVSDPSQLLGKNILLVDDVITTGATLEACGQSIIAIPGVSLSIAVLAHASK